MEESIMLKIIISTLILIASANFSLASEKKLFFWNKKEKIEFKAVGLSFVEAGIKNLPNIQSEIWVNDLCAAHKTDCLALKMLSSPNKLKKLKSVQQGNYGSAYCKVLEGTLLIVKENDGPENEFCLFKDKTMIDAWQLYGIHSRQVKK